LRSIGQIGKLQTIQDNNESYVPPREMLRELMQDNKHMAAAMRKAHKLCDEHEDSGTASLLEVFIDETERRTWFLFEASRQEGSNAALAQAQSIRIVPRPSAGDSHVRTQPGANGPENQNLSHVRR